MNLKTFPFTRFLCATAILLILGFQSPATAQTGYYAQPPLFHPQPNPNPKAPWNVRNLGPVGIGIDLAIDQKQTGFTMVISNVEKGSPAEKTGKFKKGQIIESINGRILKDIDPRIILGDIITEAEASDGKVVLKIKDQGDTVVSIPVMGRYSPTWPLNCPKSDKIVRNLADLLAKREKPTMGAVIFMLSTGESKDLDVVRGWMRNFKDIGSINWHRGYMGPGVCEYYLRTGDASVLPAIKGAVKELEKWMYNGGWSARSAPASFTYSTGTGQLHAAGVHCMTFLLMARMCGVEVDEYTLQETLTQFYRFAGHGNVAYGDGFPEGGYTDNGKHSGLALAMSAAARLTPDGESSVYAKARDNSAMKAFYATNWFHAAHTGGGLGEIWHHSAMSLMSEKRPVQHRSYLDTRRWVMDLSRRHDGSIGIAGMTDRYDVSVTDPLNDTIDFGTYFALTYTLPRKHLQLHGAPRSKFAKTHKLPVRPWGNEADDIFLSNEYVANPSFSNKELLDEKVPNESSFPVMNTMNDPQVSEEHLARYLHHPEIGLRVASIRATVLHGHHQTIIPCLKSNDARLRHLGVLAIRGMFKGNPIPDDKLTPEMFELIGKMINDPNESWWVTQDAIVALARADKQTISRHRDRLLDLLDNRNCAWTKTNALTTLARICTQPDQYKIVLPHILTASTKIWNNAASYRLSNAIRTELATATPEVKAFAGPLIEKTYNSIPPKLVAKGGAVLGGGSENMKGRIGSMMASLPGGSEFIRYLPKKTLAYVHSGDEKDKFVYKEFKPDPRFVGQWQALTKRYGKDIPDKQLESAAKEIFMKIEAAKNKKGKGKIKPSYMILQTDPKFPKGHSFWSGDMLITENEARRMQVRTVNGKQYLLVELGEFPEETVEDWFNGYFVYIKAP
jgi:Family of unknown function (DUF6288)